MIQEQIFNPGGLSAYKTLAERWQAIGTLMDHGCNYFVGFIETNGPYGLSAAHADWVGDTPYIKDCQGLIH